MPQGLAHRGWWFRPHVSTERVLWASTGGGAICVSELSVQQGRPRSTTRGTGATEGNIGYHEGGAQEGLASSGEASGSGAQGPDENKGAVPHREVHEQRPEAEGSWVLEQLFKTTDWIVEMR